MAKTERRYHHGDLRRALMDAALDTVAEGGVPALSLREAARRAGVSNAAPYHHFEGVQALVGALCEEGFAGLDASMRAASEGIDDPGARMVALGRAYVRFAVAHPAHYRLMFSVAPKDPMLSATDLEALPAFGLMLRQIWAMQAAGLAPRGDAAPLALMAWSSVHGLASLLLDGPLREGFMGIAPDALDLALAKVLVDGFAATARLRAERG
ncbi:MAG: TetR/AcrR family transcriptional regulator [Polyangiales bacterium]